MNSKSTAALILLAAVAGAWLWKGDEWGPKIGLQPSHPAPAVSPATAVLDGLAPEQLTRIEIAFAADDHLVLEKVEGGWRMPGNWPLRKQEVEQLVATLGNLRTRYAAIMLAPDADLAPYGLSESQKPLLLKLTAGKDPITLAFGDPAPGPGETSFTRPSYVHVNDFLEVLQLGPDVLPIVKRPAETYRRRQLFTDIERVKLAVGLGPPSASAVPDPFPTAELAANFTLPGIETDTIRVSWPAAKLLGIPLVPNEGTFTLKRIGILPEPGMLVRGEEPAAPTARLGDAWELAAPVRDHVDPARLRAVLSAVADLWVEQFVSSGDLDRASDVRITTGRYFASLLPVNALPAAALVAMPVPIEIRTGLQDSKHAVTVKQKSGEPVTVRFGGLAKVIETEETSIQQPPVPGMPPQPTVRKTVIPYRLARVDGNPQVFVVRADKYPELFTRVGNLKDPQVARFAADEVWGVEIHREGGPDIKLTRKKGNPRAIDVADRKDRWLLDAIPNPMLADGERIRDVLELLAGFRAENPDRISYSSTEPAPATVISILARDKRAEGEPDAPSRTITIQLGKPDRVKQLLPVQLQGWPRVTQVSDKFGPEEKDSWLVATLFPKTISGLLARPAAAYRGRKLFDTADASLSATTVTAAANGFALSRTSAGGEWSLTAPISSAADPGKSEQLALNLSGLEATEYLADRPTAPELQTYGLDKPARTVTLEFTGGRKYKLDLGNPRPGKAEVFARLDGGSVFGLSTTVVDQLTSGVLGLLPLRVWAALPDKITSLEVARTGDAAKLGFKLTQDGANWKLTGPFTAAVLFPSAQTLLNTLGSLLAVKYQALTVANAADFGLDKPVIRLKLSYKETKPEGGSSAEQTITKTLIVGGPSPDGGRYAMLDTPNAPVFVVPGAFVAAAETPPIDLLDRALLYLDPTRIAKIRLAPEKAEDAFALLKDDSGKWSVEGISFAVDAPRINQLTGTVSALPVMRLADYGDAVKWTEYGLDKPATTLILTVTGGNPATHTVAIGKADLSGSRYVRVDDGKAVGIIPPDAAGRLLGKKFDYADHSLLTFDPTLLVGFNRKQGKDELELAPAAAVGWDEVKPVKLKADQLFVEELADLLGRLRADRVVAFGKKDDLFKQYGLEPSAVTITLTIGDKAEQRVLRLGNPVDPAKPDGERYTAIESAKPDAIVGVIPGPTAAKLLVKELAFRDHTLAKFVDADKATLERGDRKITFAKVGVTWKVTEPLAAAAESAELEALAADLGRLRADTWVGTRSGGLTPFGLEKPLARWQFFDGAKPVLTLLLGVKLADGRVHVITDKGELVGLLDPVMSARVLAEYRQRRPWELDAAQVEGVEIVRGDLKFELRKFGTAWIDPAKAGEPIDVGAVNELLGTLGALRVERYAADTGADAKLYGLIAPEMRLTVNAQGGVQKVLEIGAGVGGSDGKQRYARVVDKDRSDVFVLSALDTARLTRDRATFVMMKK